MIEVSQLTKIYGPRTAIHELDFSVNAGEIVGFLGPNGAGKSTTMKILTGFMPATSGTATVSGYDVFKNSMEVKRNVGYLPENPPVYLEMVVNDYVTFAAKLKGVEKKDLQRSVDTAIEKTGLGNVKNRLIGNLSKGFRQRVGIAQALVNNPKVLILDEPTVGLDPVQIIDIRELIKSLGGDHTIILSSHILPEVTATCSRIIVVSKGRIVAQDSIDALTSRMGKGRVYTLVVKNVKQEGVTAIQNISGVRRATSTGSQVVVELEGNSECRDTIVETAVSSGMGVLEFASEKVSLEKVFLDLTTEENLN